MRYSFAALLLALLVPVAFAQLDGSAAEAADPAIAMKIDSLRRAINLRTLSDADKKEIRSCDRDKAAFLKAARAAEPGYAPVDKALTEAKLAGANPNDSAVMALLEKKFGYEKAFDQRFYADARGKKCGDGDARRAKALARALEKDKRYQALLQRARTDPLRSL
jgi:hypothetical protein